jgi:5-methylcytosine-specific restriction endonuclease McrA
LARDKTCQHCGINGRLHVHHIIPFRMFSDIAWANADDNLVALCPPCHRREEARWRWISFPESGGCLCLSSRLFTGEG